MANCTTGDLSRKADLRGERRGQKHLKHKDTLRLPDEACPCAFCRNLTRTCLQK
ncbi:hypothetical protein SynBIOSE41_03069 [Synechococcus sp. BIOS-E4-1]|nr:hypothetical protein SynBIOSE41_03069 [Synechococcus sp. BIOS-E4-1]